MVRLRPRGDRRRDDRRWTARPFPSASTCCSACAARPRTPPSMRRCARTCGCPSPRRPVPRWRGAQVLVNLSASNIVLGQGRHPPAAVRVPVAALHRRLRLRRRGAGRVHHRPGLGRARRGVGPGRAAGRDASASARANRWSSADVDIARIDAERLRTGSWGDGQIRGAGRRDRPGATVEHAYGKRPPARSPCAAALERFPFVPVRPRCGWPRPARRRGAFRCRGWPNACAPPGWRSW